MVSEVVVSEDRESDSIWKGFQAASVLLVLAVFLYSLREILNPFLLYGLLLALLYPFKGARGYVFVVVAATFLTLLWVLHATGSLLAPFILAFVLAYILDPIVDRISARPKISRTMAIFFLLFPIGVGLLLLVIVAVPALGSQAYSMVQEVPGIIEWAETWVAGLEPSSLGIDLPFLDENALLLQVQAVDGAAVVDFLESWLDEFSGRAWATVLGLGRGIGTMFTVVGYIVLTPVIMFYLLRDYDSIIARAGDLVPAKLKIETHSLFREYDGLLSLYLRGQVSVALIVGAITWLGLLVLGFPYSFLLGVTVAVLGVVPYVGLVVSLIPAILIALTTPAVVSSLLKVGAVFGIAQVLEGAVISPRIVGESVGLHPVWIVLALSLCGFYFGFVGLLIGVPLAVGVKLLLVRVVERYRATELYREGSALSR